jgi:alcohol dehydrogenase (cytochrome c)
MLYWGVGNPSPAYSGDVRPVTTCSRQRDRLAREHRRASVVFSVYPHDEHDRDAAQTPVLANLLFKGVVRKVICWPNRTGFYYVLDRGTGEFMVGVPFVEIDWAEGLTSAGRPILARVGKVSTAGRRIIFVPAIESSSVFTKLPPDKVMAVERTSWSSAVAGAK